MQTMWRVYRCTRKDEDYTNYKGAVNAARQSKKRCEQKLACNIKKLQEEFLCIYQESKSIRDKVGQLECWKYNIRRFF